MYEEEERGNQDMTARWILMKRKGRVLKISGLTPGSNGALSIDPIRVLPAIPMYPALLLLLLLLGGDLSLSIHITVSLSGSRGWIVTRSIVVDGLHERRLLGGGSIVCAGLMNGLSWWLVGYSKRISFGCFGSEREGECPNLKMEGEGDHGLR